MIDNNKDIENWEEKLERIVKKTGDDLSYQNYTDAIMIMLQNKHNRITGFEVDGDFRYVYYYSFDRLEDDVAVILPNRPLNEQEKKSLERYKDYQLHDYLNKDRSYAVLSIFYDYPDDYLLIPRLRPVWKHINEQIRPIYEVVMKLERSIIPEIMKEKRI